MRKWEIDRIGEPMDFFTPVKNWREAHRFWSLQIAFGCMVLNGALIGLAAFVDFIDPWMFLGLNIGGYALVGLARLTRQKGLHDE